MIFLVAEICRGGHASLVRVQAQIFFDCMRRRIVVRKPEVFPGALLTEDKIRRNVVVILL